MVAKLHPRFGIVVALACTSACDKCESSSESGDEAKAAGDETPAGEDSGGAKGGRGDAAGDEGKSAAGGEVKVPAGAVTECPESLAGKESIDRVIKKECGTVPVTADYKIDGGTLVLEAGAKLEFKEGTGLQVGYYDTAKLVVNGTKDEPVVFSTSGDKVAGVWRGVQLYGKAGRSSIKGAVIEFAGNKKGALYVEAPDVEVVDTTVRDAKDYAIETRNEGTFAAFTGNTFTRVPEAALRVSARAAGTLGEGNVFDDGTLVQVDRGKIAEDTTWAAIGAPWLLTGRIDVHGDDGRAAKLTLAAGSELQFDGDGHLQVGYYGEGSLTAVGEGGKEIVFTSHGRQEAGSWRGVTIYGKGEAEIAHAKFQYGGKKDNEGALLVADDARVSLVDSSFETNDVGIVVRGDKAEIRELDRVAFSKTPVAFKGAAPMFAALGGANTYADGAVIELDDGKVAADATWHLQPGAAVHVTGKVQVAGATLKIDPGSTFAFKDGVSFEVGYYDTATLEAVGTQEAPITFAGMRESEGSWKGLVFHDKAKAVRLEHVVVRHAGGDKAAVVFRGQSEGKVEGLKCEKCSEAALTWDCKSTVEQNAVEGTEGTLAGAVEPTGC